MAATSAVILHYPAGLHAGVAVEHYKTYKQFEIPMLVSKTSSSPGETCQFRQKGKAWLKCSDHVCLPHSACGDFLPPGMLLCFPPADHQHKLSWHNMLYKNDSKHNFSPESIGMQSLFVVHADGFIELEDSYIPYIISLSILYQALHKSSVIYCAA